MNGERVADTLHEYEENLLIFPQLFTGECAKTMMTGVAAKQMTLQGSIYKTKKWFSDSAYDSRKPLYQAVFAPLPTDIKAKAACWHCIKDGMNIDPS